MFRNMQFRLRQFLIAIVGTAVVFAMALLVTGIREGFETEAERTLDAIGGDAWVVPVESSGPFTGLKTPCGGSPTSTVSRSTRTARIEPRTPEGDVYVTDPFAALVALEAADDLSCQYVGHIPTAKDYGTFPMYVLKRRA
jgi:hypothetical protein